MIRWIDKTLGTAAFEDPATLGFEKLDVRGLVDGAANQTGALLERIEAGVALLRLGKPLLVCCDFGISRSNTLAAAILARRDALPFDEAFALVRQRVAEERMDYGFVQTVRAVLEPTPLQPLRPQRVLVTGGTGFLGERLRTEVGDALELVPLGTGDLNLITSPYALDAVVRQQRPGALIHLASPRVVHTHEVVAQSVAMLRNVTDVCAQHGIFLVYPSSWIVFNGRKHQAAGPLGDDEAPLPYGNHAMAKSLCEQMIRYLRETGRLQAAVLRLTTLYGPGSTMPRFLHRFAEHCRAGQPLVTHRYENGRPQLQLLHVGDAARALALAAERRLEGTFNIGGREARLTHELGRLMAEVLGSTSESREVELRGQVANIVLDTAKAHERLGWSPQIGLWEGFADTFRLRP